VLAFHFVGSVVSGFGGLVAPPFSRFYIGGETDLRGFYIRSISPIAFFPTIGSVCNRDANGNKIWATDSHGTPQVGTCGSSTQFPYNTPIYPGGDSDFVTNAEYRIPIAGPVTLAYFVDLGMNPVLFPGQLQIDPSSLSSLHSAYPYFPLPKQLSIISATNFRPHGSTGLELQVILPIVNAPVRVFYGYNFLRLNENVPSPQGAALPPRSMFPNDATYIDALQFFQPFRLQDKKGMVGFTVARTF
jgi:outer membrane protein insertion porin family